MPMLDIFDSDAFGVVSLTDMINKLKFVPGRIGSMGLFKENGVATTSIAVEEKNGILTLISPSPRGGTGTTLDKSLRKIRRLTIPHFEINDSIMAEEVQGVRAFGAESEVETVQGRVTERGVEHTQSMSATQEYSRVGAVKGIVTYADATTLNLFTEFGVSQPSEVDFDLDNANSASGALRKLINQTVRDIAVTLDGVPLSGVGAICGDAFYDDFLAHPEVRSTFTSWTAAAELRQGYIESGLSFGAFPFGGVLWENYRGAVGGTTFVNTDKCHMFPIGAPGLFRTVYAPADYEETVNTIGQRLYARQFAMPNGKGRNFDVQMNAIEFCTRPNTLVQGKRT